ncbi:hypothetical protein GP486_000422 [Trichoglossum hirsutum]|uniref:Uncharacterized protein n=1 Tax=Trichoglossum hirsutum TaxID=265104 RepID=A0A9P8RTK7_9PEZI|nr:hypothetical protein GP486_000422 [Trichoglossum hirsutum]
MADKLDRTQALANARVYYNDPQAEIITGKSTSGYWWAALVVPNRSANPSETMFKCLYYTSNRSTIAEATDELIEWIRDKTVIYGTKVDWNMVKYDGTEVPLPRLTTRDFRGP